MNDIADIWSSSEENEIDSTDMFEVLFCALLQFGSRLVVGGWIVGCYSNDICRGR